MKWIFYLVLLVLGFMYVSKVSIQFKPFKISFADLSYGFGWLFALMSIIFFRYSAYREGNMEGYKEALHDVKVEFEKTKGVSDK